MDWETLRAEESGFCKAADARAWSALGGELALGPAGDGPGGDANGDSASDGGAAGSVRPPQPPKIVRLSIPASTTPVQPRICIAVISHVEHSGRDPGCERVAENGRFPQSSCCGRAYGGRRRGQRGRDVPRTQSVENRWKIWLSAAAGVARLRVLADVSGGRRRSARHAGFRGWRWRHMLHRPAARCIIPRRGYERDCNSGRPFSGFAVLFDGGQRRDGSTEPLPETRSRSVARWESDSTARMDIN